MGRSLKYDIPGTDWRRSVLELSERGFAGLFAESLEAPFDVVLEIGFGRGEFLLDLAAKSPGKSQESNWLPAPTGPFWMVLRTYGPGDAIKDGSWKVPPIKKAK